MSDPYPHSFTIEFDRQQLTRYLRAQWLLCWMGLAFLGLLFGASYGIKRIEDAVACGKESWVAIALFGAMHVSIGICVGVAFSAAVGFLCYRIFSHRLAARHANGIEVSVEGAFLNIRKNYGNHLDRKLHFRAIVDYATMQDGFMRRFGIHALTMTTIAGAQSSNVQIVGVKDALKVRDMLADVDRLRENL